MQTSRESERRKVWMGRGRGGMGREIESASVFVINPTPLQPPLNFRALLLRLVVKVFKLFRCVFKAFFTHTSLQGFLEEGGGGGSILS